MKDLFYYLWLSLIDGVGAKTSDKLLRKFESPKTIFQMSVSDFVSDGVPIAIANKITQSKNVDKINKLIENLEKNRINCINIQQDEYPERLKNIYDPPIVIYTKGELPGCDAPYLSVIGTRKCSEYGANAAYALSRELAQNGVIIVSGMAEGIDSMAHKGALAAMEKTVAVLGCGADICYPAANETLMRAIIKNGCVISEYPPGTRPLKHHFPARNRIISGLSDGVLVVEAGEKSGTLITVDFALDQGRDVFAVPGNVTSNVSAGTNFLIKEGAALVTSAEDILSELNYKRDVSKSGLIVYKDNPAAMLEEEELIIFNLIGKEPVTVERLTAQTGASIHTVIYILTCLEIKGLIVKLPGNRYLRE